MAEVKTCKVIVRPCMWQCDWSECTTMTQFAKLGCYIDVLTIQLFVIIVENRNGCHAPKLDKNSREWKALV